MASKIAAIGEKPLWKHARESQAMLKTKEKYRSAVNWAAFTIIGNPE